MKKESKRSRQKPTPDTKIRAIETGTSLAHKPMEEIVWPGHFAPPMVDLLVAVALPAQTQETAWNAV